MVPPRHRGYEHTGGRGHGLVVGKDPGRKPDLAVREEIGETAIPEISPPLSPLPPISNAVGPEIYYAMQHNAGT